LGRLTESIVSFLQADNLSRAPEAAVKTAINGFTDCVGVMVAGQRETLTGTLLSYARSRHCLEESRVLLSAERSSSSLAALIGTGSAHALDYDDYAFSNHVSALLVPPILAEAERCGADGDAMIQAYLAGYETWGSLFKREPDHLHSKGWHPTGVFGAPGVTAALCRLRRLDRDACRNALGLAACSGGGVMDNFGSQAKAYQGARAAEAGVVCAELAAQGLDAGPNAIDGSGGLLAALSPRGEVDLDSDADWLGRDWIAAERSLNIKRYPTVGASQRLIDAAIQLHADHRPEPGDIAAAIARISEKHDAVMRFHRPRTAHEARFSLEFGIAAGLISGRVTLAELTDDYVRREDVQALMRKISRKIGPDDDPAYPVGALCDSLRLELLSGAALESEPVHRFLGHGENPMSPDQLREKFLSCTVPSLGERQSEALFSALSYLPELGSALEIPTLSYGSP
jgi:2-methylcitrate dehydratase PrpD